MWTEAARKASAEARKSRARTTAVKKAIGRPAFLSALRVARKMVPGQPVKARAYATMMGRQGLASSLRTVRGNTAVKFLSKSAAGRNRAVRKLASSMASTSRWAGPLKNPKT